MASEILSKLRQLWFPNVNSDLWDVFVLNCYKKHLSFVSTEAVSSLLLNFWMAQKNWKSVACELSEIPNMLSVRQ